MKNPLLRLSLDVEADGPCPGLYSMLSFALVSVDDLSQHFYAQLRPISNRYNTSSMAVCNFTRDQVMAFGEPSKVMKDMQEWLKKLAGKRRAVVWSDNPAFDWQFFNYYCHAYLNENPCGHSARRIGDLHAGWVKDQASTRDWRKWRGEAHTHNALDDARGNARALANLFDRMEGSVRRGRQS